MILGILILIVSIFVSIVTGSFVFIRNTKQTVNRAYAITSLLLVLFSIFNYLSLGAKHKLLYIRLVVLITNLVLLGGYYLIYEINHQKIDWFSVRHKTIDLLTLVVAILDLTPLVFSALTKGTHRTPIPSFGIILFAIQFFGLMFLIGLMLIRGTRQKNATSSQQNKLLLIGVLPILVLAPITGFILPVAFNNSRFIIISPLFVMFFVCMVGYSIIKHGLFDIQFVIARAITYLLSIGAVALIYGLILLGIIKIIFHPHISIPTQLFLVLATALVALTFQQMKRLFDKFTNKFFYRDAYDIQAFLDRFNKILITYFDIDVLLNKIIEVLEDNYKSSYIVFGIKETAYVDKRIISSKNAPTFNEADIRYIRSLTPTIHKRIIVTDDLGEEYDVLKSKLLSNNIAIIARLATDKRDEAIGYLILSKRKSGNIYSFRDLKLLEIITNEIVVAIQNSLRTEEINNFNLTLQDKIKSATYNLRRTNEKLKSLDEAKDDFVSMASHQLRTPLTAVKGNISLVLEGDAGNISPLQRKLLEQAFNSSQRMVYLIADLLNVSRLKTGKFIIETSEVNLIQIVDEETQQLIETAKSRQLSLSFKKPNSIPLLKLDETKTRQVIMNFIDNAIYYTPAGGAIVVELSETKTNVELRVIDNGIGVSKSEQPHLFTKFYRAGNARKARPDGTGLGLFMAKKVIISEGGSIIFQSEEGKGSTFGFSFSKANLAVKPATENIDNKLTAKV